MYVIFSQFFPSHFLLPSLQIRELRSENEALRREVKSTAAAMATTNEALSSLQSRSDRLSHTLVCEMEYYCHASEPHELVALECMKTQLASRQIHLHAGGSPAVVRMTSYIRHKESGQASSFILLLHFYIFSSIFPWYHYI